MVQMFVPSVSRPTRQDVEKEIQKIYPDAKLMSFLPKDLEPGEPTVMMGENANDFIERRKQKEIDRQKLNKQIQNTRDSEADKTVAAAKKDTDLKKLDKTYGEAKMPVKGLVKLAAMVADNNKKRKNALQIQKYIGEDKKMGRQSDEDLSAARDKFSNMDQSMPSNKFMLGRINKEINRRKKAKPDVTNEETISERRGQSKSSYSRNPHDNITSSVKKITRTGIGPGIEHYSDDEKKKSEKEKIKDAKDPKKNKSREKATQNMQMIKRMTPEQQYARKMRIKQQQKDKK